MIPDDAGCTILHVDMDAFYVSVASRDRPGLAAQPVVVGGAGRGVVLAASYPAREYGVRSGMSMSRARRLCPQVVIIPPDFERFSAVSTSIMEMFRSVTPAVEALSTEEAFLDVSGALCRFASPREVGAYLRARVADEQHITCSVGIAPTTHLAKVASRRAKPDGLLVVPRDGMTAFLHPLAVEELWGVGEVSAERLHRMGLHTVGDLAHTPRATLQRVFGERTGAHLHAMAWGATTRPVQRSASPGQGEPEHSIGSDETFGRDTDDPAAVRRELLRLAHTVAARMRAAGVAGRTVTLKVRFADFTTLTRSRTLTQVTDLSPELYAAAVDLFAALGLQRARIRLVGIRVERLVDAATAPRQLVLGAPEHGWEDAERAVDRAASRFGSTAVRPATLLS